MAGMVHRLNALVLTLALAFGAAPAVALTTMSITSFDAGWYRSDGAHSTANTNIIAGRTNFGSYNNFFAFDLAGVSGKVLDARLTIASNGRYQSYSNSATYSVHGVSTSVSSLVGGTGGTAAYADLGSGTLYGQTTVSTPGNRTRTMPTVTLVLDNALRDLNAAQGGQIAFGGSTDASPYLWGYSGGAGAAVLTVSFDPTIVLPIPAPIALLLTAFGALALAGRRRHRKGALPA